MCVKADKQGGVREYMLRVRYKEGWRQEPAIHSKVSTIGHGWYRMRNDMYCVKPVGIPDAQYIEQ